MYCKNCGQEIDDKAVICPKCGVQVAECKTSTDSSSFGYALLGFFIPIVGLILFLIWKDEYPLRAKSAGKGALISVIVSVVLGIIYGVIIGVALLRRVRYCIVRYFKKADIIGCITKAAVGFTVRQFLILNRKNSAKSVFGLILIIFHKFYYFGAKTVYKNKNMIYNTRTLAFGSCMRIFCVNTGKRYILYNTEKKESSGGKNEVRQVSEMRYELYVGG